MKDETESKPKLKRRRTHAISVSDNEDDEPSPPLKKVRSKTASVAEVQLLEFLQLAIEKVLLSQLLK